MKKRMLLMLIYLAPVLAYSQRLGIETFDCDIKDAEKEQVKRIAQYEARFYNVIFDTHLNDSVPVKINLYGKAKEYEKIQADVAGAEISSTGFYSGRTRQIYVYKHKDFVRTLLHETSHSLLHSNFSNPPIWLNEGLAEFLGSLVINENEIYYAADVPRIRHVIYLINNERVNLQQFLKLTSWSSVKTTRTESYTIAYAIIYFLVKKHQDSIKQIVELLKQRYTSVQAITYVLGDFNAFDTEFRTFYRMM